MAAARPMLPPVPVMTHTLPVSLTDISSSFATAPGHSAPTPVPPSMMNSEPSRQVGAAVNENRLTVYVGAVVREQERHHGRDVLGGAEAR